MSYEHLSASFLKKLFKTGDFSDVTLGLKDGTTWNLHKAILAQSEFFKTLFESSWQDIGESHSSSSSFSNLSLESEAITPENTQSTARQRSPNASFIFPETLTGTVLSKDVVEATIAMLYGYTLDENIKEWNHKNFVGVVKLSSYIMLL